MKKIISLFAGALNEKDKTQTKIKLFLLVQKVILLEEYDQQGYPVIFIEIPVFKNR